MKIIANGPEYSSGRVIAVRRTVYAVEENPCGKRKRKGKRWARGLERRETLICISNLGRPSQDFHAALRCTRPLRSRVSPLESDTMEYRWWIERPFRSSGSLAGLPYAEEEAPSSPRLTNERISRSKERLERCDDDDDDDER